MAGFPVEVRERALAMVWEGSTATAAARAVGADVSTVCLWVKAAGMELVPGGPGGLADGGLAEVEDLDRVGGRLCLADRVVIQKRLVDGVSLRKIAAELGVSPSTVSREVKRNTGPDGVYLGVRAQRFTQVRSKRPKPRKLDDPELRAVVVEGLNKRFSPAQIAGSLRVVTADGDTVTVSHETIYQALYVQGKGALRHELTVAKALRSGRSSRIPASKLPPRSKRPWISADNHISARPAEADDRAVPGHWEGDLVIGGDRRSCLVTLVERTTRFALIRRLDTHDAATVADTLTAMIAGLPAALRRSLAWDQGAEMAQAAAFSIAADIPVYFCDPHSPWQRGSNENLNGLIRDFYPKGTRFDLVTDEQIAEMEHLLNIRPRQTLDFQTPAERLNALLRENVALTA